LITYKDYAQNGIVTTKPDHTTSLITFLSTATNALNQNSHQRKQGVILSEINLGCHSERSVAESKNPQRSCAESNCETGVPSSRDVREAGVEKQSLCFLPRIESNQNMLDF